MKWNGCGSKQVQNIFSTLLVFAEEGWGKAVVMEDDFGAEIQTLHLKIQGSNSHHSTVIIKDNHKINKKNYNSYWPLFSPPSAAGGRLVPR